MQSIEFQLDRDYIELNNLLKLTGVVSSGGAGKMIVASGDVRVNGVVETRKTCKILAGQLVSLDDVEIKVIAGA